MLGSLCGHVLQERHIFERNIALLNLCANMSFDELYDVIACDVFWSADDVFLVVMRRDIFLGEEVSSDPTINQSII